MINIKIDYLSNKDDIATYLEKVFEITIENYNNLSDFVPLHKTFLKIFGNIATSHNSATKEHYLRINYKNYKFCAKHLKRCHTIDKHSWQSGFYNHFKWLNKEIQKNNEGKRAVILAWNTDTNLRKYLCLGEHSDKLLPFLGRRLFYGYFIDYDKTEGHFISPLDNKLIIKWKLYGTRDDNLNMVMYW